jgi:probable rRNA maturation factor
MTPGTTKTAEPPQAREAAAPAENEPPESCADISIEDARWTALDGVASLIPPLAASTLVAIGLAPETHAVSIALLSDAQIRSLNKAFRGTDAATNVLSFPSAPILGVPEKQAGPSFLGDVALAFETVTREASEQGKPVLHHVAHLTVHGLLHLAGLGHDSDAEAERMESAERLILSSFGIPDPYGDDGLAPPAALKS